MVAKVNECPMRHRKKLRRKEFAAALTNEGYKIAPATLSTLASRGGGPPFRKFGRYPIYDFEEGLDWARNRCSPPVTSTSELLTQPARPVNSNTQSSNDCQSHQALSLGSPLGLLLPSETAP